MPPYTLSKPNSKSTTKKIVNIIIYLSIVIIFVFASLEIFARYYFPNRFLSPLAAFEIKPNLPYLLFGDSGQYMDFTKKAKTINELGFHATKETPIKKPDNTYRIFFLGASVADYGGSGIPKDQIYYALLEQKLNAAFPTMKFECISGGISSYIANQELVWFMFSRILEMSPDVIIMFDGYNDIAQPINHWSEVGYPFIYKHRDMMFSSTWYYFVGKLSNHSMLVKYFFNYMVDKYIAENRQAFLNDGNSARHLAINYVDNMEKISALLCAYQPQAKMLIALQPIISHKPKLTPQEQEILYKDYIAADYVKKTYPVFMQHLNESTMLKDRDVAILDITDTFADCQEGVFSDTCHFDKDGPGSRLIAERFYDILRPMIYGQLNPSIFEDTESQIKEGKAPSGKLEKNAGVLPQNIKK